MQCLQRVIVAEVVADSFNFMRENYFPLSTSSLSLYSLSSLALFLSLPGHLHTALWCYVPG